METNENTVKEIGKEDSSAIGKENTEKNPIIPVLYYLDDMLERIRNKKQPKAVPTGFYNLDQVLDGGLYAGLYFLGASSSLGKTTFIGQIANQIAAQGRDVYIFSLEMARDELTAKDISRLSGIIPFCINMTEDEESDEEKGQKALSIRQILNADDVSPMIETSFEVYRKIAKHIFVYEGMGNVTADTIRAKVKQFISEINRVPIVIVDYLQIIAPFSAQYSTDKQNIDKTVLELKRLSRDQGIPIIAISSLNRQNYTGPINMSAFKESGSIEYSADVLLGLQLEGTGEKGFDIDAAKQKRPREVELKVLKNRNGPVGSTLHFAYRPQFNLFTERKRSVKLDSHKHSTDYDIAEGAAVLKKLVDEHFAAERRKAKDEAHNMNQDTSGGDGST